MPGNYIIYARKSSESEERQDLSIQAQLRELRELAVKLDLNVVDSLEEAMSARSPGRPVFRDLMNRLDGKDVDGVLCWKLDRLARNPIDGGEIIWKLGKRIVRDVVAPGRTYTGSAQDKFMMSIEFGTATKYSDDLSDNVRRGNREALAMGFWTGPPKIGYLRLVPPGTPVNAKRRFPLGADPERFEHLGRAYRLVLDRVPPLEVLRMTRAWGLKTPTYGSRYGGRHFSRSSFYRFLRDEFYTGTMIRGGIRYQGTHPPLISRFEFVAMQDLLDGRVQRSRGKRLTFPYRGMVVCGTCGSQATARRVTKASGRVYTYYHCYRKERRYLFCPELGVREQTIDDAYRAFFSSLIMPPSWSAFLLEKLRDIIDTNSRRSEDLVAREAAALAAIEQRKQRHRDLLVRQVVSEKEYTHDVAALNAEAQSIQNRIDRLQNSAQYLKPWIDAAELLNIAKFYADDGTPEERSEIARRWSVNSTINDKSALIVAKNPLHVYANWRQFSSWWAWWDHVKTAVDRSDQADSLDIVHDGDDPVNGPKAMG